jgi:hypothetical protein
MALRAEQWLMLGVVGIGITAAILLTRAKPRTPEALSVPLGSPAPPLPENLRVPNILGRNAPPGSAFMNTGTTYRGRLELPAGDARTREQLRTELEALGFRNVTVYMSVDEAGDEIPLPDAKINPTSGTRFFTGIWPGASVTQRMPPTLRLLWVTVDQRPS